MRFLFILGASGTGKSVLEEALVKSSDEFHKVISYTTRPPRDKEVNGVDYNFITHEDVTCLNMIEKTEFKGNIYGICAEGLSKDKINVMVIEPNGFRQMVEYCINNDYDYDTIYLNLPDKVRMYLLNVRDGSTERLNDGIKEAFLEMTAESDVFQPTITITKLLSEIKLSSLGCVFRHL